MMKKVKCMIVDDEPLALNLIKGYIAHIPQLDLIATANNGIEAYQKMQEQHLDLIFLDIQMPQLSGMDFLRSIQQRPKIILTTAYREYAIESYDLDVVDYLLKPISLPRFLKAVNKCLPQDDSRLPTSSSENHNPANDYIYVYADKKNVKVFYNDILYLESLKDYVSIYTSAGRIVTKDTIKRYVEALPKNFVRIHRSFIVNRKHITAFTQNDVEIGKKEIPIGVSYRKKVTELLQNT